MYNGKRITEVMSDVDKNSIEVQRLVDDILNFDEMDDYIAGVKEKLNKKDMLTDKELERITLKLPLFIYSASNQLENMGIKSDIGEIMKTEKYSQSYNDNEGTIPELKNKAQLDSLYEEIVEKAYKRAYKKLKKKLNYAESLYMATKKILSKRTSELDFNKMENNTGDGGFEEEKENEVNNKGKTEKDKYNAVF